MTFENSIKFNITTYMLQPEAEASVGASTFETEQKAKSSLLLVYHTPKLFFSNGEAVLETRLNKSLICYQFPMHYFKLTHRLFRNNNRCYKGMCEALLINETSFISTLYITGLEFMVTIITS